jgi:pimeloyl-ACP methyl ester carboxylesterase
VHLVGISMGGILAQHALLSRPERVASATLIATAPGNPKPYFEPITIPPELRNVKADTREEVVDLFVRRSRLVADSPAFPFEEGWFRHRAAASYDRSHDPAAAARQQAAVDAEDADFLPRLAGSPMPFSIIQGRADRIAKDQAALDLMNTLPNADLHFFTGVGHATPGPLLETYAAIIDQTIARGEGEFGQEPGRWD